MIRLFLIALFLFVSCANSQGFMVVNSVPPASSGGAIALDGSYSDSSFSGDSIISTAGVVATADDLLVVYVSNVDNKNVTGVSDSSGNTYTHISESVTSGGDVIELWYSAITTAGTLTVTGTFEDALATYRSIQVYVVSGLTNKTFGQSALGTGDFQTDLTSVNSITTTVPNSFVIGGWVNRNSYPATVGGAWIKGEAPPSPGATEYATGEYQVVTATGTYSLNATFTSQSIAGVICSFD